MHRMDQCGGGAGRTLVVPQPLGRAGDHGDPGHGFPRGRREGHPEDGQEKPCTTGDVWGSTGLFWSETLRARPGGGWSPGPGPSLSWVLPDGDAGVSSPGAASKSPPKFYKTKNSNNKTPSDKNTRFLHQRIKKNIPEKRELETWARKHRRTPQHTGQPRPRAGGLRRWPRPPSREAAAPSAPARPLRARRQR